MSSSVAPMLRAPTALGSEEAAGERRTAVRYSPDPLVPVFFAHPLANLPTAGLIADISAAGCRIMAPPTARPELYWGDPLQIVVSYSESTREASIEGMRLWAHVVRLVVDSRAFVVSGSFSQSGADGDWNRLQRWIQELERTSSRPEVGLGVDRPRG